MTGLEIIALVSGAINVLGSIAGLFGWRRHQEIKTAAQNVERAGEAVIQGVEACERLMDTDDAKVVKQSVQTVAEAAGVEDTLHDWLVSMGLSRE